MSGASALVIRNLFPRRRNMRLGNSQNLRFDWNCDDFMAWYMSVLFVSCVGITQIPQCSRSFLCACNQQSTRDPDHNNDFPDFSLGADDLVCQSVDARHWKSRS